MMSDNHLLIAEAMLTRCNLDNVGADDLQTRQALQDLLDFLRMERQSIWLDFH